MTTPLRAVAAMRERSAAGPASDDLEAAAFRGLHWMTAGLFLATGAGAAATERTGAVGTRPAAALRALRLAPVVLGPAAGVAHAARALRPEPENRMAALTLGGIAVGAAAAATALALADALRAGEGDFGWRAGRRSRPSPWLRIAAPLAFGATGLLGLILDREEREEAARQWRLQRRASIVERLVPRRRARLDRIVVHV